MNPKALDLQRTVQKLMSNRDIEGTFSLLNKTIEKDSKFVEAWMLLASIYRAIGQAHEAIGILKECLEKNPKSSVAWTNLGHLYMESGQFDSAIETNKKAITFDKQNPSPWYSLGMAYLGKEDFIEAIKAFQSCLRIDPNRIDAWRHLGSALEDNKQYKEAINAYEKVVKLKPDFNEAWAELAITYKNSGDLKKALKTFEKVLKFDSKKPVMWFHYGTTLSEAGKYKKAVNAIKEGLKLDSSIAQAWMDLADVYEKMGDKEGALEAKRRAFSTGKVDVRFAADMDEARSHADEWQEEQKERKQRKAEVDRLHQYQFSPSWSFGLPTDFEEHPDGNRMQLTSPDGARCITVSSMVIEGKVPPEKCLPPDNLFRMQGGKFHSDIRKEGVLGYIFENEQYLNEGVFMVQCAIAGTSRILMLTFTVPPKDKQWALDVIKSIKFHK